MPPIEKIQNHHILLIKCHHSMIILSALGDDNIVQNEYYLGKWICKITADL